MVLQIEVKRLNNIDHKKGGRKFLYRDGTNCESRRSNYAEQVAFPAADPRLVCIPVKNYTGHSALWSASLKPASRRSITVLSFRQRMGDVMRHEISKNRREFLRNCLAGVVGIVAADGSASSSVPTPDSGRLSRVSIAHDSLLRGSMSSESSSAALRHGTPMLDSNRVSRLLDAAMQGLLDSGDIARIWSTLVHPGQLVGIKVNTLGGRSLSTNVQLVESICDRLQRAGIRPQDIVIWDRDTEEMARAGFLSRIGGNHVQCYGTDRVGFEDGLSSFGSVGTRVSRILTRRCDVLINVPVLKDHDGAGVSIALKNMYGVIHNPNKYHPDGCNPYIADVNMLPEIRSKLRLHICDATNACFHGGPAFKPEFMWHADTLIASTDPVALDHIGWQMIERKRANQGLKSLEQEGRAPAHIATAADAEHRLGTNDPKRIVLFEKRLA